MQQSRTTEAQPQPLAPQVVFAGFPLVVIEQITKEEQPSLEFTIIAIEVMAVKLPEQQVANLIPKPQK